MLAPLRDDPANKVDAMNKTSAGRTGTPSLIVRDGRKQFVEATEPPSMEDLKAARRKYGKYVDRFEGADFLADFTTEELIGPLR